MNPIVSKLSPTVTRMIRMDHSHVVSQFHKLTPETSAAVRAAVVRNICTALEIHAQLEEELFYPALREARIQSPALDKSASEHEHMRELITRVRGAEEDRARQDDTLNELMNAVLHHVADEETQLLPAAERLLGPEKLAEMGARMTARRIELARPHAAELAGDMVKGAPAKTALMAVGALLAGSMVVGAIRRGRQVHH